MRVAIFVPGSLGDVRTSYHVPAQTELISQLAEHIDMNVFSLRLLGGDTAPFSVGRARVVCVDAGREEPFARKVRLLIQRARQEHRRKAFDLVHGIWAIPCGTSAVLAGRFWGIPSIVSLQGGEAAAVPSIPYGDMLRRSTRLATRATIAGATAVTALTSFQRTQLTSYRIKSSKIHIIPYGAGRTFCPATRKRTAGILRILHVANLTPVKDQLTLLRAFAQIRSRIPARLRIVGPDHADGTIQRAARSLGVDRDIEFAGQVLHNCMPEEYRNADILLQTSLYEGQGVAMVESMASGTVVVSTRVGIAADLDGTAILTAAPGDTDGLASRVLQLAADRPLYLRLQNEGLIWSRDHDSSWTASQFATLYRRLSEISFPEQLMQGEHT